MRLPICGSVVVLIATMTFAVACEQTNDGAVVRTLPPAVTYIPLATSTAEGEPQATPSSRDPTKSDIEELISLCENGFVVPDPDSNLGLVSDCVALLEARAVLAGEATLTMNLDFPIMHWGGVKVSGTPWRVREIFTPVTSCITVESPPDEQGRTVPSKILGAGDLSGQIPASLGRLDALERLDLSCQKLTGDIPPEIGKLRNLKVLDLKANNLTGSIPKELGSLQELETLDLTFNELTGEIPGELGEMQSLREMLLTSNRLSDAVPPQLSGLTHLRVLDLSRNELSGSIPVELGLLVNLGKLELSGNRLAGAIPPELGNMKLLLDLHLDGNQLVGKIPAEIGQLPQLFTLKLRDNNLSGCIDPELRFVASNDLHELDVQFCDSAPLETQRDAQSMCTNGVTVPDPNTNAELVNDCLTLLAAMPVLTGGGILEWDERKPIAEWEGIVVDGAPPRIREIELRSNEQVWIELEDGKMIEHTKLSPCDSGVSKSGANDVAGAKNQNGNHPGVFTGNIPDLLGNLGDLEVLIISCHSLTGGIPSELGKLGNLKTLSLTDNQLNGEIPRELSLLSNLESLNLSANRLNGEIPVELGKLRKLESLHLSSNELYGAIPGSIGGLVALEWLDLSNNKLSGAIPKELGSLSQLFSLDLRVNQLVGEIPPELGSLGELRVLDLSANGLTGAIPSELAELNLSTLFMSGNEFTGCVPAKLAQVFIHDLHRLGLPVC